MPKVLLHDHLDGGLRPETIVELADVTGYDGLPTTDPDELKTWIATNSDAKNLVLYLRTFEHTIGVMRTADAIARVACECAEDLAADGLIYAEVRFAPELFTQQSLSLDDVIEATLDGFTQGTATTPLTLRAIICAMRHETRSLEVAEAALRWRDKGVVGFDIAGPEDGYPPDDHLPAFSLCHEHEFPITIHAGEAFGPPSIDRALYFCGADRLGHGVRIVEDGTVDTKWRLGKTAKFVLEGQIPLEVCPTSNVHTGICDNVGDHPFDLLWQTGFNVSVNTDNRLMSDVTLSSEFDALVQAFDYGLDDLETMTTNAMKASFLDIDEIQAIIDDVITPGFAALR